LPKLLMREPSLAEAGSNEGETRTQAGEVMDTLKTLSAVASPRNRARRALVAGLGGVALGGVLTPVPASKKSRKAVKRAKKQSKKKCRNQEGACAQALTEICQNGNGDPADTAACITQFTACCAFLADCQVTSFFDCAVAPR